MLVATIFVVSNYVIDVIKDKVENNLLESLL
jgi:hypothetical protein